MKWNQFFSHNTRRREGAADSLLRLLAPSLLGMAVCMLTLCSLTWAWFNMSIDTNIGTIQSASVEVCVSNTPDFSKSLLISGSTELPVADLFLSTNDLQIATFADDKTSTGTQNALYFIVRSNVSANCSVYLKVGGTYYGLLNLVEPGTGGSYPADKYPVYFIDLSTLPETTTTTTVSIHWGNLPESTTATELSPTNTISWPTGNASVQTAGEWEIFVGRPSSETSEDENQNETETPANDDTINDDAKTPDDTTTGDAVKDPSGVTGDTPTGTGDSGTAGTGDSSGTGSDATGGDSGTGGSETGGDADNATNSVSGDVIPAGGSV